MITFLGMDFGIFRSCRQIRAQSTGRPRGKLLETQSHHSKYLILLEKASWRSGDAADCKSVYTGSIPVLASNISARSHRLDLHVFFALWSDGFPMHGMRIPFCTACRKEWRGQIGISDAIVTAVSRRPLLMQHTCSSRSPKRPFLRQSVQRSCDGGEYRRHSVIRQHRHRQSRRHSPRGA